MILVSCSSAEDVLSNDVKNYNTFSLQGTETLPFRFFGGHPVYIYLFIYLFVYLLFMK